MAVKSSHVIEMQPLNTSNEPSQTMSAQNQLILEQQDQHLDSILGTVQNLRDIAFTVGNELDEHQEMLEEIDLRMDSTQDKLGNAMQKVKSILERTQNMKSSYIILILVLALSILAILLALA
ncbi:hypothetical protein DSO57_1027077 [Entomophthora muscae]|uniref:Uncharacterized protein n=1 Tax=Entomophthora muscae TaxID=34485 RepID=A0ACC2SER7_9FUNG|nr:hypothetical protein DSO57_1027077 [Entomophthora muscae]